jgi:hypothetical protein
MTEWSKIRHYCGCQKLAAADYSDVSPTPWRAAITSSKMPTQQKRKKSEAEFWRKRGGQSTDFVPIDFGVFAEPIGFARFFNRHVYLLIFCSLFVR